MFRWPVPTHTHTALCRLWHLHRKSAIWGWTQHASFCCQTSVKKCNALNPFPVLEVVWGHSEAQVPPSFHWDVTFVRCGLVCVRVGPRLASIVQTDSLCFQEKLGGFLCLSLTLSTTRLRASEASLTCCNTTGNASYTQGTWHQWWQLSNTNTHTAINAPNDQFD